MIQPVFEAAFREYGLPVAIRTDNGLPFATTTVAGLSRLSIWWLKLGIIPEHIEPGKPAQNGRHEPASAGTAPSSQSTARPLTGRKPPRHRNPPKAGQQQQAFDRFRVEYNEDRPHEAIGQQPPASLYSPSPRPYPLLVPEMTYPDDTVVRKVCSQGDIKWKSHQIYLSDTLAGELVGLRVGRGRLAADKRPTLGYLLWPH